MRRILAILIMFVMATSTMSVIGRITVTSNEKTIVNEQEAVVNECEKCGEENIGYPVMTNMPPESERPVDKMISEPSASMNLDDLPGQFSWKDYGGDWTTPVKDQAYPVYCGSCYIFGTWAAFEAAINIASGSPDTDKVLSEQYGLSCINDGCNGCGGGWGSIMIENIMNAEPPGVPLESCMPYTATDTVPCSDKCEDWDYHTEPILDPEDTLWQIKNWGWTSAFSEKNPADWATIKSWLMTYGPLAVSMAWDNGIQNFVDTHHNPTDVYQSDSSDSTNHIILLCGWVDDSSIYNGGYWILKNSHGTAQGYGGFCNIAYGCNQLASSECSWIIAEEWPDVEPDNPIYPVRYVYAGWDYGPECPKPGTEIEFADQARGPVVQWDWDFDGDGVWDVSGGSKYKNPTWTYDDEGSYQVTQRVWSSGGLTSTLTKTVVVKNIWPPVAVSKPSYYGGKDNVVHFDGRYSKDPDGNVVAYAWDFNGDGTTDSTLSYDTYTYPNQAGEYEASLKVTDNEGATNTVTIQVNIDKSVPPVTNALVGGVDLNEEPWFNSRVMVELRATDWSGLSDLYYKVDDKDWVEKYCGGLGVLEYSFNFYIQQQGLHTIQYYAKDYYGNIESIKTATFGIDLNDPTMDVVLDGDKDPTGVYIPPVILTVNANDADSGVKTIACKIDSGDWVDYTAPFTINQGGSHFIYVIVKDKAGNTVEDTITVTLEHSPDAPSISGPSSGKPTVELTFNLRTTDYEADQVAYYVDWGDGTDSGWSSYVASGASVEFKHTWTQEKQYTVKAKAKDSKGAESDWTTRTISLPKAKFFIFYKFLNNFPVLQKLLSLPFFQKILET